MSATLNVPVHLRTESLSTHWKTLTGHLVLFLAIPGAEGMAPGCAMLMGRLLQETLERDLKSKCLLAPEPPSTRSIMAAMRRETALRLDSIRNKKTNGPVEASSRFMEDVARRLYEEPLLSFVRNEDQFYFSFYVSDLDAGEKALTAEVQRLGFLELAEIGRYDAEDRASRTYHPKDAAQPLTPLCVQVLQGAGFLPREPS